MRWLIALALGPALAGCGDGPGSATATADDDAAELTVTSTAFAEGGKIPAAHTCEGADTLPPPSWSIPPPSAESLAIVVEDPDAPSGTFTHLVVAGLPADLAGLEGDLPVGAVPGTNDAGEEGLSGPCPPPGDDTHRYRFTVLGLGTAPDLSPGFAPAEFAGAAAGHVVARGTLTGTFDR